MKLPSLAEAPVGTELRLVGVDEDGELGERLMELGLTPGVQLVVVRRGIGGDPLQLAVRGYLLSIRRAQARKLRVAQVA